MKKLFIIFLAFLLPVTILAQDKITEEEHPLIKKVVVDKDKVQDLKANLIKEYGLDNIKFLEMENGNYLTVRSDLPKDVNNVMETQENTALIILATVGVVLVVLLIIGALANSNK